MVLLKQQLRIPTAILDELKQKALYLSVFADDFCKQLANSHQFAEPTLMALAGIQT